MAHQLTLNSTSLDELKAKVEALPEEKKIQESKTVTPTTSAQTVTPDSGYDGMAQVTVGAVATATLATPMISVHPKTGEITATVTQGTSGYVVSGATSSHTELLAVQTAQTITPGTANQTIASGQYLVGTQTILGDADLVAGTIKKGVAICGVTGTVEDAADLYDAANYGF